MAKLLKAVRRGNKILVEYSIEAVENSSKIYLCIMDVEGSVTSRPIKIKPGKHHVSLDFGEESVKYKRVYLGDSDKKILGTGITLPEALTREEYKELMIKCVIVPIVFFFVMVLLIKLLIIQSSAIKSCQIQEATLENLTKIFARGEVVLAPRTSEWTKQKTLDSITIELKENDTVIEKRTINSEHFYVEWSGNFDISKKYQIACKYEDKDLLSENKTVKLDPRYPIAKILSAKFNSNKSIEVITNILSPCTATLVVEAQPKDSFASSLKTTISKEAKKNRVTIGPFSQYKPFYIVRLVNETMSQRMQEMTISCPFVEGKLSFAQFVSLDTIQCRGMWAGPESKSEISLECYNVQTNQKLFNTDIKDRQFSFSRKLSKENLKLFKDLSKIELEIRLINDGDVLHTLSVSTPEILKNYLSIKNSMPKIADKLDTVIQNVSQNPELTLNTFQPIVGQLTSICNDLSKTRDKFPNIDFYHPMFLYYINLKKILNIFIETFNKLETTKQKYVLDIACENDSLQLSLLCQHAKQMLAQLYPEHSDSFSFLQSIIEKGKIKKQKLQYLENIQSCVQKGKLAWAVTICDEGLKLFSDSWEFLWMRYQIYKRLSKDDSQYKEKYNDDLNKLSIKLPHEFSKQRMNLNNKQAYIIGLYLQELPNLSQNFEKDIADIGKKLSDEEKAEAYQNSLKWIFTFENYKGKSNE